MNKTDLINKLKQLEGLTQEERAALIELVNTKKKYGLVWEDKPEEVEEQLRTHLPVLREVVEKRILADQKAPSKEDEHYKVVPLKVEAPDTLFSEMEQKEKAIEETTRQGEAPNHILIEGDNLHALTALTFTHEGKIDVIYIDPPYNTGNKDFKYNDSYVDKEDSYRHSKWLSFMDKRLRIAKRLLSENGVIIISIDEIEIAELKLLCNGIFNPNNFIAQITLLCNPKGRSQDKYFNTCHEYCLIYSKSELEPGHFSISKNSDEITSNYKLRDQIGYYRLLELRNTHREFNKTNRPNLYYSIYVDPITMKTSLQKDEKYSIKVDPVWNDGFKGCWTWGKELFNKDNHLLVGVQKKGEWKIFRKSYSHSNDGTVVKKKLFTIWNDSSFFTERGQAMFGEIFPGFSKNDFPQPKSVDYIKQLLASASTQKDTILDFFAGSGTTLHATMQLNSEDGGYRQCILVTNNENNICEEVTYERNKRVIQGYINSKGQWVEGIRNNNLRYYKSEFVPSMNSEPNKRMLTQCSTDLLCIKEGCYQELTKELGFNARQCRIFKNEKGKLLIVVYHSRNQLEVCEQLIAFIKTLEHQSEPIKLYGFSPEKETLVADFIEVADKIEAVPLPEAINNAYKTVFQTLRLDKKPPTTFTHSITEENEIVVDDELSELNPEED